MPRRVVEAVLDRDSLYVREGESLPCVCCALENNSRGIGSANEEKKVVSGNTAAHEEQGRFAAPMILNRDEVIVWGSQNRKKQMQGQS